MAKLLADQIAEIKAKREKLAAKLNTLAAKAKTEDRKRDTRRKIVVGAAILTALEHEPALAPEIRRILSNFLTRDNDREVVGDLLGLAPSPAPAKSNGDEPQ